MKNSIILLIFLILSLTSCQCQNQQDINELSKSNNTNSFIPTDSSQFYFPLELLNDTASFVGRDTFLNKWYSKHLFAMKEPVFFMDKSNIEIFRFTWLRTFHNPIAIRIEKHGDKQMIYWKLCSGAGGYDPGELTINKQTDIDDDSWMEFKKLLNQCDFWKTETNESGLLGNDGSKWILEGKLNNKYHVVDRWTPNKNSDFYKCCDFLISLTNLKIKKQDKY